MAMKPAVFLDKDGTLLHDVPYNVDPRRIRFAAGAKEGIGRLGRLGISLIVITNQPGIALRKFGFDALDGVRHCLRRMFEQEGAALDGFYFCPHHPAGSRLAYARSCDCRKPAPGLLHMAAKRHDIDLASSWFIGDILDDVEAGSRAGCRTILIDNGNETEWVINEWRSPDHLAPDLAAASRLVADHLMHEEGAAT